MWSGSSRRAEETLLDHWMPVYDVRASYAITVRASPERVYRALWETDFDRVPLIRALLTLRSLPDLLLHPRATCAGCRLGGTRPQEDCGTYFGETGSCSSPSLPLKSWCSA